MTKVVPVSEIDSKLLFEQRQYSLGDQKGKWVVMDGDLVLGIYEDKVRADFHADCLNNPTSYATTDRPSTVKQLEALVTEIEDDFTNTWRCGMCFALNDVMNQFGCSTCGSNVC